MADKTKRLVPYKLVKPGWEGVYTGEKLETPDDSTDEKGNVIERWSTWAFTDEGKDWNAWDEEIVFINKMQEKLGVLDDDTRQIRAHIGSLVPCDSGFPVTVDELLIAIGRGKLSSPSFHNGCWHCGVWWNEKGPEPGHLETMRTIQRILKGYPEDRNKDDVIAESLHAAGFVNRTYQWLGAIAELTNVQKLMIDRLLVPFDFWTIMPVWETKFASDTDELLKQAIRAAEGEDGRGAQIDAELIHLGQKPTQAIPHKHNICDCHHNTFRYIEKWIYRIGTGEQDIPSRKKGTERARIGRLLFGYSLALDKWLLGIPMQFLLLELGHVDLGFDPKNEILRVYAYLGEDRNPVKEWLAACLWYSLAYNSIFIDPDYKVALGRAHKHLIGRASETGMSIREWADSVLGKSPDYR